MDKSRALFVIGSTASGKTSIGVELAKEFNGEIISVDSRQVYRGLDLGTGKDLAEYGSGETSVKYHLIDIVDATEEYSLYDFVRDAKAAYSDIVNREKLPIFVGGTHLYIDAILSNYAISGSVPNSELRQQLEELNEEQLLTELKNYPNHFEKCDRSTNKRLVRALENAIIEKQGGEINEICFEHQFEPLIIAPYFDRKVLHDRIHQRLIERINDGMIEEGKSLMDAGVTAEKMDWFGLEYRYLGRFLTGEINREEMTEQLFIKIRQFCKRQAIWLRKLEREDKVIQWLPKGDLDFAKKLVSKFLQGDVLPKPVLRLSEIDYGKEKSVKEKS